MKRFLATGLLVVVSVGIAAAQQPGKAGAAPSSAAAMKAVTDLENKWVVLSKASDGDGLGALLADDFVALDADGTMHTKAEVVARTRKNKWTTNEVANVKVTVHGDSAIATGSWIGKGTDANGKPVDAKERWADTWVKMANGQWQCVVGASAPTK
jgi:ketosteroid isomerase-like protein